MRLFPTMATRGGKLKILFLHGLESKPGGAKVKLLESLGHEVINPALPKDSWSGSIRIASECMLDKPDIVIGSSRGGALAMHVSAFTTRLILIAPAWDKFNVPPIVPYGTQVLHSLKDDVVEYAHSTKLLSRNDGVQLIEVGESHRMNSQEALDMLATALDRA